ncbi:MAG: branched-chain amino acid ABC transporter permease, partial [Methyloligellaceae bacterium]
MTAPTRKLMLFGLMAIMLSLVGFMQSWSLALAILNLCLISAIMALGVNIQWGYAGLFNVGVMGFAALGGLAGVLVSMRPVPAAWAAGGTGVLLAGLVVLAVIVVGVAMFRLLPRGIAGFVIGLIVVAGYIAARVFYDPAVNAIESVDSANTGYLGGLGLPIILSWFVGGAFAAGAAWIVGKIALGLRSDYLAIATLGISEIIVAMLKNEDWLTRGVKNVTGLPRPVPYEVDLQRTAWFQDLASSLSVSSIELSSIIVKLCYAGLFLVILLGVLWLSETALR